MMGSRMESRFDTPAMKRISDWILSQELPSDITIQVEDATFNLHKLRLASRCGYIRRQLSGVNGSRVTHIDLTGIPGGAMAFELVTKFCYDEEFEVTEDNVAMLRCAAEHLEMDDGGGGEGGNSLGGRAEAYLEAVALTSLAGAVAVLRKAEELLPVAEDVGLVGRCIDAIACITCSDGQLSVSKAVYDWWADELTSLRIDTFQRVLIAMKARGFKGIALGTLIMLYAQKSLRRLDMHGREKKKMDPRQEHEKRVVIETVVSLLPKERNSVSVSFLSMLLRAALHLDTTLACRLDLERRMSAQLGQAALDDLLIPSSSPEEDAGGAATEFDVDAVRRILAGYLEHEGDAAARLGYCTDDDLISTASPPNDVAVVGRLVEAYLAEIASDANLPIDKFTGLAEMIPERARFNEDGMYRAIDIYLKAHPHLSEAERKKVCKAMDCQKLSREACAHAAQNDRLPVQTVVQVLYHEQRRLREAPPSAASSFCGGDSPATSLPYRQVPTSVSGRHARGGGAPADELSWLQRENDDLRMEVLRLKMRLRDPSPSAAPLPPAGGGAPPPSGRPPLPKKPGGGGGGFVNNVSKKLGRLNPFLRRLDAMDPAKEARTMPPKDRSHRRHSIGW
ncbi:unnamed protein product [Urochloa humidicola]